MQGANGEQQPILQQALIYLQSALQLLDRASAPPQIGAQVDLARHQLASYLEETFGSSNPGS